MKCIKVLRIINKNKTCSFLANDEILIVATISLFYFYITNII